MMRSFLLFLLIIFPFSISLNCGVDTCYLDKDLIVKDASFDSVVNTQSFLINHVRSTKDSFFENIAGNNYRISYDESAGLVAVEYFAQLFSKDFAEGGRLSHFFYPSNKRTLTGSDTLIIQHEDLHGLLFGIPVFPADFCRKSLTSDTDTKLTVQVEVEFASLSADCDSTFLLYDHSNVAATVKMFDPNNVVPNSRGIGTAMTSVIPNPDLRQDTARFAPESLGDLLCTNCTFYTLGEINTLAFTYNVTAAAGSPRVGVQVGDVSSSAFPSSWMATPANHYPNSAGPVPFKGLYFGAALQNPLESIELRSVRISLDASCPFLY